MTLTSALTPAVAADRRDVREDLRVLAVATLVGAAVVHARVAPGHLEHWPLAGAFFAVLALAEVLAALVLVLRRSRGAVCVALAVSLLPLLVWTVSRSVGLPLGPEAGLPEPVSWADSVSAGLELATASSAALLLRADLLLRRCAPASAGWVALGLCVVTLLTAVGVAGAALSEHAAAPVGQHDSAHDQTGRA